MGVRQDSRLNSELALERMANMGLSQADIGREIRVSRQTVSQWLHGERFPRPDKLLRLGRLLELSRDQLVVVPENSSSPVCLFRLKAGHKATPGYQAATQHRARLLELLVPHLPYDCLSRPPTLIDPRPDDAYVEQVAVSVRKAMGKDAAAPVDPADLLALFQQHHAVVVPVFWNESAHEHGLHVYLPASMTTWVFVNLQSRQHDFKFWLAHELGHMKAPSLGEEDAELFADAFAGALLLPRSSVAAFDRRLRTLSRVEARIGAVTEWSRRLGLSPLTLYYRLAEYARDCGLPSLELERERLIFRAAAAFSQQDRSAASFYFTTLPPRAEEYVAIATEQLGSPFFRAVREYMRQAGQGSGFLQTVLQMSVGDAQALHEVLSR